MTVPAENAPGRPPGWSAPTTVRTARQRARWRARGAGVVVVVVAVVAVAVAVLPAGGDPPAPAPRPAQAGGRQVVSAGVAPTGVGNVDELQPAVARAVRRAIAAAAADGVTLRVTSGWRSADEQAVLHAAAIQKYGSPQAARRWVLPSAESEHVRGGAVDVGPPAGAAWLARHGVRVGLCRRYDNEPWHFERLAGALGSSCPAREAHP